MSFCIFQDEQGELIFELKMEIVPNIGEPVIYKDHKSHPMQYIVVGRMIAIENFEQEDPRVTWLVTLKPKTSDANTPIISTLPPKHR